MKVIKRFYLTEHLIYLVFWIMLFLIPVVGFWLGHDHFMGLSDMTPLYGALLLLFIYLVLFLINSLILLPRLFFRHHVSWYVFLVLILCAISVALGQFVENEYHYIYRPSPNDHKWETMNGPEGHNALIPPDFDHSSFKKDSKAIQTRPIRPRPDIDMLFHYPNFNITFFILAIMVISFNMAISLVFKALDNEMKDKILAKETVVSELEYLKYQINPHFLMNTLNNIHALVDIDSETAKETIINLSKMMRFVLYKGPKDKVSLLDEIEFLKDYIELMRIRYIDSVDIRFEYPENIPTMDIPSLLFVPFVENAFKHGVSYQKNSFIHIAISGDEKDVNFEVVNSKIDETMVKEGSGGIGLDNTKRRLNLIYGTDYTLDIDDDKDSYKVNLKIKAL